MLFEQSSQTGRSLDDYLRAIAGRLRTTAATRGAGGVALTALLATAACVYLANKAAFSPASVAGSRLFLGAVLALAAAALLVLPLRRLLRSPALQRAADEAERRSPEFDGRLRTWADERARSEAGGRAPSPLVALLARETEQAAAAVPLDLVVSRWLAVGFAFAALVGVGSLVWLGTSGPGYWQYGTARLWAGWFAAQDEPLYELVVEPGDATIREGGRLEVTAEVTGFEPASVEVHAKFESSVDWERAPMGPQLQGPGYVFSFSMVREPLRYYVTAGRLRSREFEVDVVEMPTVENVRLEYEFPAWSGLEPVVEDPGGDIAAVSGTRVQVVLTTDKELSGGLLVVGDDAVPLQGNRAGIEVSEDSTYHVAARHMGERVRLTEDYFITVVPDEKPTVKIRKPGRDWRASSIEEVAVSIEAADDFGLRGLELRYSVNGAEERAVPLMGRTGVQRASREHLFYLEDLGSSGAVATLPIGEEADPLPPSAPEAGLIPGDLISYYVVAEDARREIRSDMYFINVQPYERRYSQSQQAGGQGGQQGQRQDEISRRQKEIILATWNLISERDAEDGREESKLRESASMLSELQGTLMQQAQTLVQRTRARQLTETDPKFKQFTELLEQAAAFMEPAAEALSGFRLDDAVGPEQQALQYLLRAENLFTDIQISMGRGGGGGGGGASRDLAEMFELEMDLEKNQYETGGGASGERMDEEIDEAMKKLEELARRQEQLADQSRSQDRASFEQRWRQEMLRREAEDLKRRLEQLQRRQGESRQQAGGQSSQGAQGQSQGSSSGGQGTRQQLDRAIQQLQRAAREMERGSRDQDPRASAADASRELQRAVEALRQRQEEQTSTELSDLAREASQLVEEQEETSGQLDKSLKVAIEALRKQGGRQTGPLPTGLTRQEEVDLANRKSEMGDRLADVEQGLKRQARSLRGRNDDASRALLNTVMELQQSEASTLIRAAADLVKRGLAPYAASNEEAVSRALRRLRDGIQEAGEIARQEREGTDRGLARLLSDVERLRRGLEQAAGPAAAERGDNPRTQGQQGDRPGQGRQPGQDQQAQGRQSGESGQAGPGRGRAAGGDRRGGWGNWGGPVDRPRTGGGLPRADDPEVRERMERALQEGLGEVPRLSQQVRRQVEFDASDIADLRRFAQELGDGRFRGNLELLEQEYRKMLALLEQLEVKVRRQVELDDKEEVRAIVGETVPESYREAVAEYYRRLGAAQ